MQHADESKCSIEALSSTACAPWCASPRALQAPIVVAKASSDLYAVQFALLSPSFLLSQRRLPILLAVKDVDDNPTSLRAMQQLADRVKVREGGKEIILSLHGCYLHHHYMALLSLNINTCCCASATPSESISGGDLCAAPVLRAPS